MCYHYNIPIKEVLTTSIAFCKYIHHFVLTLLSCISKAISVCSARFRKMIFIVFTVSDSTNHRSVSWLILTLYISQIWSMWKLFPVTIKYVHIFKKVHGWQSTSIIWPGQCIRWPNPRGINQIHIPKVQGYKNSVTSKENRIAHERWF